LFEDPFIKRIPEIELNEAIAGVDSGFVSKRLQALDIMFLRAVGVVFEFKKNLLTKTSYLPNFFSFPEPIVFSNSLENDEFNCNKSLLRLKSEINTALQLIESFAPSVLFLDGSLIPQHADKPRKGSKVNKNYKETIKLFEELFKKASEANCVLIGAVEDSRGSRWREIIQKQVLLEKKLFDSFLLDECLDTSILNYLLSKGERSFAFPYTSSVKQHPILADFKEKWSEKIFVSYLKAAEFDRPLRIEFFSFNENPSKQADFASAVTFKLSSMHKSYAYPSVLIEADLRARLKPEEIETVFDKIVDRLGKGSNLLLRREKRPFG
jgi:hypothetical protein